MTLKRNFGVLVSVIAIAGLAVAGCSRSGGGSSTSSAASPTRSSASPTTSSASPSISTGEAKCTEEAFTTSINEQLKASGESVVTLQSKECADGWAVAQATVGNEGGTPRVQSFIFEAEGEFWIPKTREQACGTSEADAEIPKSLYGYGCSLQQ